MKVLRLHAPHDLRLHDEPTPVPSAHEVLVRVTAAGICGSDLHWYSEGNIGTASLKQPLVLGHEFCGVVESGDMRGRRVVFEPSDGCGQCEQCHAGHPNLCQRGRFAGSSPTDGAFREYAVWPRELLFELPQSVSDREAAMLEPFCNGLQAIDLGHVHAGMVVSICGCGPIGLVILQAARAAGAAAILMTDKLQHRMEAARRLGASDVFAADGTEAQAIMEATGGRGVDVAFEAAGHNDALAVCANVTRAGGRVIIVGIPVDEKTTFNASVARAKGLTFMLQRRSHPEYPRTLRLLRSGLIDIGSIVSHEFPLTEGAQAFDFAEKRRGLKVLLRP